MQALRKITNVNEKATKLMCLEMEKTGVETSMNKKEGSALDLMT